MFLYFPERERALTALLINPPKKHELFSLNIIMFNSFMRLNTITKMTDCRLNKGFCSFKPNTVKKKQNRTTPNKANISPSPSGALAEADQVTSTTSRAVSFSSGARTAARHKRKSACAARSWRAGQQPRPVRQLPWTHLWLVNLL